MQAAARVGAPEKLSAVVIAAGHASRLRPYSEIGPKALMELAPGVTPIDLLLSQLAEVGIDDIVVVTRPEHASAFAERLNSRAKILVVSGDGYGNLHSVAAALEVIEPGRTLLAMSDHVFEMEVLRRFVEADHGSKQIMLCIDTQPTHRDLREGLRVETSLQNVRRVGKTIPPYSGVDAGLFVLSPDIRALVAKLDAEKVGKATISDLVNCLAAESGAGYVDVSGKLWMDIDTPEDLLEARRCYREIVRRSLARPTDGPVSRWLNRPISTRLTIFLFNHVKWATPNLLSFASFLVGIASALLLVQSHLIIGGIMVHLSSILDGVDGELARLRGRATAFGSLLDSVLDRAGDISLVIGLGLLLSPGALRVTLTALAVFGVVLVSYVSHLAAQYSNVQKIRASFPWATRDVRLFSITVGGLIAQPILPLIFCATAPIAFVARILKKLMPSRKTPSPTGPVTLRQGHLIPSIAPGQPSGESHEIRKNIECLAVNLLKMGVALVILQLLRRAIEKTSIWTFAPSPLDPGLLFDLGGLIVFAYFGYRILMASKFFADRATDIVVGRLQITKGMYGRTIMDVFYLIFATLSWSVVTPMVARLPDVGAFIELPLNLVFFGLTVLLLYDLLKTLNRGLRGLWDELLERVTHQLTGLLKAPDPEPARPDGDESR